MKPILRRLTVVRGFKSLFVLWMILATMALAQVDPKVVGTWAQEGQAGSVWTFRGDGTGVMEQNRPQTTAHFSWTCQGAALRLVAGGLKVSYTVVKNDGQQLVIRNDISAVTYVFRRTQ